ncbi:hypothetical protein CAPTEDRAFT_21245 [Capitella teleta]|uniref:Uncharacterized protein n=1 Tax=Capitella teleta TaxID=283909 RepID=R7VC03_CAPTE|nr:hypothetical protein CAPTEDRAFT_21245 [Capitella teleta]|eukprot:ELU13841.1 hypothetical protein CAPTEDRAFT_21245 [Capitella teleta]
MQFFRSELGGACEALMKLQLSAGQPAGKPEELERVERLLGVAEGSPAVLEEEVCATKDVVEEEAPATNEETLTPKRSDSSELIEISETEFENVSSLVRGRVKRSEVNFTYRILWSHFKEKGNTKPLSRQDMHQMGLRVTGQTGLAKLNVLKQLKILKIARNGNVELL